MIKTSAATLLAIATSYLLLLIPPPTKSSFHSLFISDSLSDNASISHHLHIFTRRPHLASYQANAEAAAYVLSVFTSCNIQSHIASYDVSLTCLVSCSLMLINQSPKPSTIFSSRQEIHDDDPYADVAREVLPTFHAYARSSTVAGPVVYVNYGHVEDFSTLKDMIVNVFGTVVLARYGNIYRGNIVQNAYKAGVIGVVIYTNKKDYGGARWFLEEKWMPPSGIQVGTVYNDIGDPMTLGWASTRPGSM